MLRRAAPFIIAFLLGLVSSLGFAPLELWQFTLAGFLGLLWLVRAAGGMREALAIGWLFGLGHFIMGLNWIATAFYYQNAMPPWLGWIAVVLLSLYLAVYPAAAAGLAWRWGRRDGIAFVLILAAAWIATEWLRATMFTGFAWNPLGVVWLALSPVARAGQWIGTYGLSALMILWAGALMLLMRRRSLMLVAALVPFALATVATRIDTRPQASGPTLRIVQPNINQQEKWDENLADRNFRRLAGLSGKPGSEPRLLLWPEAAVPDYLEEERWARMRLARLLGPKDILLTGGIALIYGKDGKVTAARNSMFALDAGGRILGRYDKAHLVPYGEYLPARPILSAIGLSRLAPGAFDFLPGPGAQTMTLPGFGPVGFQICYEIIFSGRVIDAAHRPRFLFNPSNDAWFGAWGPPQHLAQARLRAIEEGVPVIRSTPTGISAVIDADGRLLQSLPWHSAGYIDARLPAAKPPTPFARAGNLLPFVFAALLIGAAIARRRRTR